MKPMDIYQNLLLLSYGEALNNILKSWVYRCVAYAQTLGVATIYVASKK
jgi:hypothetical protein